MRGKTKGSFIPLSFHSSFRFLKYFFEKVDKLTLFKAITNCHYADDTILFLEAKHERLEAAWWTMQAFR